MTGPRVATCQFEPTIGQPDSNIETIENVARNLPENVAFAVFPELCVVGYDLAVVPTHQTTVPGPMTDRLTNIARDVGVDLIVGIPEADNGTVYNSLVYVGENGVLAAYRKRRLWGDEAKCFDAGTESATVDTPVGKVGLLLCYDLNYPELSLTYAQERCDLLVVSAAWRQSFEQDWRLLCRARALDGTCYVIGSNHVGAQVGRQHAGESCIVGPRGNIIAKTVDGRGVISASVSQKALTRAREKNPVLKSRE